MLEDTEVPFKNHQMIVKNIRSSKSKDRQHNSETKKDTNKSRTPRHQLHVTIYLIDQWVFVDGRGVMD